MQPSGKLSASFRVLFVCTGNICRSPAAELLLRARLSPNAPVLVSSAGTRGLVGRGVDAPTASALRELGIDPAGHRARRLDADLVADADLVLTAETVHRSVLLRDSPLAFRKSFTMREFARLAAGLPTSELDSTAPEPRAPNSTDVDPAKADRITSTLIARVGEVAEQRGIVEAPEPGTDEISDPFGAGLEPARQCVLRVAETIDVICRTLAIGG